MIFPDAMAAVGKTPLVELSRLSRGLPAREEGILAGVSSGAALSPAAREDAADMRIVVLLADTGDRYLTTDPSP